MGRCLTLSQGRELPCRGGTGGIKAVAFAEWSGGTNNIVSGSTAGEVSGLNTAYTAFYRYELKHAANTYVEEIASDPEARTVLFNGTLSLTLQKLDLETRNEVKMLTQGETVIFIETNNDEVYLIGAGLGAQVSGGNFNTGGARADLFGTTLTFVTSENEPYLQLSEAAKADYESKIVM